MKVTVCEIDPREGFLERDLADLAEHVAAEKTDFLLLPELSFFPWLAADKNVDPSAWQASVEAHEKQIAKLGNLNAKAVLGTRPIVNEQGSRRNEAYIWNSDSGLAAPVRQKYYLPDEEGFWEHHWYDRGPRSFDAASACGLRIGVQICTEMWFLDWARHYAKSRVDVLCVPRASPHTSAEKWLAGGRTSAVCSGAYSLSSNLWYPKGAEADCGGLSWIIDPEGEVLARTDRNNRFATVEIDLAFRLRAKRHSHATYQNKTEIYFI